jgi:hypothetical protein
LHRRVAIQPDVGVHGQYPGIARIALNSLTRMVIDIAYAFNVEMDTFDIDLFSPSISHIVKCAQQHIVMGGELRTNVWHKDFEQLKKMLAYLNQRWSLAGKDEHSNGILIIC